MSIKAYVGIMGSGKTYEVVTEVILGALGRGRRVVSNIAGLNAARMREVLIGRGIAEAQIGELVGIAHEKVLEPNFWRTDRDAELGIDAFVQPGDLLALDEIWRFWNGFSTKSEEGQPRPARVMNFFRMHRQFTHAETGVACDVAIITQDPMDISRQVRSVIEETYSMEKLTAIGSTTRYRVDIFHRCNVKRRPLRQLQRSYDPALYDLYKSHSQKKEGDADAKEENIDQRGNVLKGGLFRIVLPLGLLALLGAVWVVWGFFHPKEAPKLDKAAEKPGEVSHPKPARVGPEQSEEWRVVGYYGDRGGLSFYLSNGERGRVLQNPPAYKLSGLSYETFLPTGEAVTSWSGGQVERGLVNQAAGVK